MRLLRRHMPTRKWFQDDDGTYYRNIPLILNEKREWLALMDSPRMWRRAHREIKLLTAEWQVAWREGVIRKAALDRGDKLVQMAPFREVYPDKPGLWVLDEDRGLPS